MNGNASSSSSSTLELVGEGAGTAAEAPHAELPPGTPPGSNTGGRLTTAEGVEVGRVKVDWLTLVFPWAVTDQVVAKVSEVFGAAELQELGRNFYRSSWRWECGAVLLFNEDGSGPRMKDGSSTCCLTLSGSVLDYFTPVQIHEFMRWSWGQGARCSRIDAAFDDFSRRVLKLADVHAAAAAGNFAGFKVHTPNQVLTRTGKLKGDGHTFGLRGKMGSGRVVQFYDKNLESNGEINAVRMEARFAKEHAHAAFLQLMLPADLDGFTSQLCGILGGSISFIDRSDGETHLDRCSPLDWWVEVLELLSSCRVVVRRQTPPLQRSLEYLRDAWSLNVALMFTVAESQGQDGHAVVREFVRLMIADGNAKLDAGKRPGARWLGLELERLLCP